MATSKKRHRTEGPDSGSEKNAFEPSNLSDAHDFLTPNEVLPGALGLLHCLTTKRLINMSFSALYQKSLGDGWKDILTRERRSLRPNSNSVEKCFMLNRLLAEYTKNPDNFKQRAQILYDEIKMRMLHDGPAFTNPNDLYREAQAWRDLQCKRRLFYVNHIEAGQLHSLLFLQRAATQKFCHLIHVPTARPSLIELIQNSFIIVAQPSGPDCVAATKYEKIEKAYKAILHARIICLLHPDTIKDHFLLSNIGVTLHLLYDQPGKEGEIQPELKWQRQKIDSAKGVSHTFFYAELSSLELSRLDPRGKCPIYNSNLCRLQFHIRINIIKEELKFESQPFGICSHAQFFPDLVAQAIIFEIQRQMQNTSSVMPPAVLTNFMYQYYPRVSGVQAKLGTYRFILGLLQEVHDTKNKGGKITTTAVYKEILAKLISQIGFFTDHPFMAMMYNDDLFLGIASNRVDGQLSGSQEQPHICIRFNTLQHHPSNQSASVRYIVHNGQLTKASFQMRAFADDMCRLVYEATQIRTAQTRLLSDMPDRTYHDFSLYFDDELFRLSTLVPYDKSDYKPLIPVIWSMRKDSDDDTAQTIPIPRTHSHASDSNDSIHPSVNQIQLSSSEAIAMTDLSNSQECWTKRDDSSSPQEISVVVSPDIILQSVIEKLNELFKVEVQSASGSSLNIRLTKLTAITAVKANRSASHQERPSFEFAVPSSSRESIISSNEQNETTGDFTFSEYDQSELSSKSFSEISRCSMQIPCSLANNLAVTASSLPSYPNLQSNGFLSLTNANVPPQLPASSYSLPVNSTMPSIQTSHVPTTEAEWEKLIHDEITSASAQSKRTEDETDKDDFNDLKKKKKIPSFLTQNDE